MNLAIYDAEPQGTNPGMTRTSTLIPGLWIDYDGPTPPTVAEVRAIKPAVPLTPTQASRAAAVASLTGTDAASIRWRATDRQVFIYLLQLINAHNGLVAVASGLTAAQRASFTIPVPTRATEKATIAALINADDPAA